MERQWFIFSYVKFWGKFSEEYLWERFLKWFFEQKHKQLQCFPYLKFMLNVFFKRKTNFNKIELENWNHLLQLCNVERILVLHDRIHDMNLFWNFELLQHFLLVLKVLRKYNRRQKEAIYLKKKNKYFWFAHRYTLELWNIKSHKCDVLIISTKDKSFLLFLLCRQVTKTANATTSTTIHFVSLNDYFFETGQDFLMFLTNNS